MTARLSTARDVPAGLRSEVKLPAITIFVVRRMGAIARTDAQFADRPAHPLNGVHELVGRSRTVAALAGDTKPATDTTSRHATTPVTERVNDRERPLKTMTRSCHTTLRRKDSGGNWDNCERNAAGTCRSRSPVTAAPVRRARTPPRRCPR